MPVPGMLDKSSEQWMAAVLLGRQGASRLGLGKASKEAQTVQTPESNSADWSQGCPSDCT